MTNGVTFDPSSATLEALQAEAYRLDTDVCEAVKANDVGLYLVRYAALGYVQEWLRLRRAERDLLYAQESLKRLSAPLKITPALAAEISALLDRYGAAISKSGGWEIEYRGVRLVIDTADGRFVGHLDTAFPGLSRELAAQNFEAR